MKFAQLHESAVEARSLRDSASRGRTTRRSRLPSMRRAALFTAFAWASLSAGVAMAEANPDAPPEAPEADLNIQATQTSQWTGVWNRQQLLGDIGGLRPWLGKYGVTLRSPKPAKSGQRARRSRERRGLRRPDDRHRADGYAKSLRSARRPVQRQRAADPRRQSERQQARHAEHGERYRSPGHHAPVGVVVSAVVPEQAHRREDRSAKYRPGIHHQHEFGAVRQHDVRLARAAFVRHAVGRSGLSAVRSRRARARPDHAFVDRARRRVRRRSARQQPEQQERHQLQPA